MDDWMDAREAASTLGVSRSTLYAYVSRGLVRASSEASTRHSRYRRSEVERLALERQRARKPALIARASLDWGRPVLNSALTLIAEGRLYYRSRDAIELAAEASLEEVAAMLWHCAPQALAMPALPAADLAPLRALSGLPEPQRCTAAFAWLAALDATQAVEAANQDPGRDHDATASIAPCIRLLRLMTAVMAGRAPTRAPLHRQLARAWGLDERGGDLVRQALVLCADHELNASSFAARCVASTGADLGACVLAGLTALSGGRHGGVTAVVEDLWTRSASSSAAACRVADALQRARPPAAGNARGQGLPGFGHLLYPDGDPRAQAILEALPAAHRHPRLAGAVHDRTGLRPSIDFALVALRRHLGLPEGHAYRLFALGRTVGWIAHVLEQRRDATLIRPRAAYVGERPQTEAAGAPPPSAPASRIIRRR